MPPGDIQRREEYDAQRALQQKEYVNDIRAQLQAAVELLREFLGIDPNEVLAIRVERNRVDAARARRDRGTIL